MATHYPDAVAAGQIIASAWGNDTRSGFTYLPLFQWGQWGANTDANGYIRPTWPIAYPGVAASGDAAPTGPVGGVAYGVRATATGVVNFAMPGVLALSAFNAQNALFRVFNPLTGAAQPNVLVLCNWMVWGPRFVGQLGS